MRWCQTRHKCEVLGLKPNGYPNDVEEKHRITPQSRAQWIDTSGLSTAGLKRRDQGFIRRGYSVYGLQCSNRGPMGGSPIRKLQSMVTSVAQCDYATPPLPGPKLKRQRLHIGLERPRTVARSHSVVRSLCKQGPAGLMDRRRRRALGWTSPLPVCVLKRNDIEVMA